MPAPKAVPTLVPTSATPTPPSPEQEIQLALIEAATGKFEEALARLGAVEQGHAAEPSLSDAFYEVHLAYADALQPGFLKESKVHYGRTLERKPDDPVAQEGLKQVDLAVLRNIVEEHFDNDPDVTIAAAKQIRRMDRDYADVGDKLYALQIAKGNRLLDEDDLDGSWGQFDEAGALKPDAPEAPNGKRQVLLAKGWKEMERCYHACPDQAIDALEQIMQIDANFREARSKLYALYVSKADRLGRACDRDGAFPHLMRALEIYPEGGEAQQGLAVCTPTPIPTPPPAAPVQVPTVTPRVVLPTPPPPPPNSPTDISAAPNSPTDPPVVRANASSAAHPAEKSARTGCARAEQSARTGCPVTEDSWRTKLITLAA